MNTDIWVFRAPKVCFWHNMEPQRKMRDAGVCVHRKRERESESERQNEARIVLENTTRTCKHM